MTTVIIIFTLLIFFVASFYIKMMNKKGMLIIGIGSLLFFVVYAFIEPKYKFESIFFTLLALSLIIKNLKKPDEIIKKVNK